MARLEVRVLPQTVQSLQKGVSAHEFRGTHLLLPVVQHIGRHDQQAALVGVKTARAARKSEQIQTNTALVDAMVQPSDCLRVTCMCECASAPVEGMQEGDRLQRLAEAHAVRQNAAAGFLLVVVLQGRLHLLQGGMQTA